MLVVVAGGLSNILLGFFLLMILVGATSPMLTNTIDSVVEHSYIEEAGIMPGDKVVKINGKKISFYDDITLYRQEFKKDTEVAVTVERNGQQIDFTIMPSEQIITVNYKDSYIEYTNEINGHPDTKTIPYSEDNPKKDDMIGKTETSTGYIIGFSPMQEDVNFFNIWGQAWNETRFVVKLVYKSLWGMVTGEVGIDQMSGPVGIVSEVNNAVNSGSESWLYILNLVALLTINLGVFNLLPIPALDGGRLFFLLIEFIRRKPIPPEKEGTVHAIGMLLLLALIVFVSFNDVMRLIK